MIPSEIGNTNLKFNGMYRGTVVDVNDLEKLGRIRVKIVPMMNNIEDEGSLPWAVPAFGLLSGAGSGFGSFTVPEIGSQVWTFFETGDIYQPVYFAEAATGIDGQPVDRETNYPNRRIFRTKAGVQVLIDDTAGQVTYKISHPSGSYIEMDNDGNIKAYAPKDAIIQAVDIVNIIAGNDVNINAQGNNVSITAANLITLAAAMLNIAITGNSVVGVSGNVDMNVDGSVDLEATGPIKLTGSQVSINP